MFRPALRRGLTAAKIPFRPVLLPVRLASNPSPSTSSDVPPPEIDPKLPPGEEIDPQLNGYPQLPYAKSGLRPPLGWWDVQNRRNFGETLHEDDDLLGMWGPDPIPGSLWMAVGQVSIMFALLGGVVGLIALLRPERPALERSYPFGGLERELGGHNKMRDEADDPEVD